MVTVIDDREGDIYAKWAGVAEQNFHLLARSMHDRTLADGKSLYEAAAGFPVAGTATIALVARANRPQRQATLALRLWPASSSRDPGAPHAICPRPPI